MSKRDKNLWAGLSGAVRKALAARDYKAGSLAERLPRAGVDAGELAAADRHKPEIKSIWIPGVEIFARAIYPQRHRGVFGEFVRRDEGILAKIGLWPKQWSPARMFAQSDKRFNVHTPCIPREKSAAHWTRRLF